MKKVIFSKYSNERAREFAIRTDICVDEDQNRYVRKTACYPEGKAHIERVAGWYEPLENVYRGSGISMNRCELTEEGLIPEYLTGQTLEEELDQMLNDGNVQECVCRFLQYINAVKNAGQKDRFYVTPEFTEVFGEVCLPGNLTCAAVTDIDMVAANAIVTQDGWVHMDYEWTFDFPIPVHFVIYRILMYYLEQGALRAPLRKENLYERAGLTGQEMAQYAKMEAHFQDYLVGEHRPLRNLYASVSPGFEDFRQADQMKKATSAAAMREGKSDIEMCIDRVEETADTVYIQGWAVSRSQKYLEYAVEDGHGKQLCIVQEERLGRRDVNALFGITDPTYLSGFCIQCRYEKKGKRERCYEVIVKDQNTAVSMKVRPQELRLRHSRVGRKLLAMTGRGPEHGVAYRTPYEMGLFGETRKFREEEQRYDSYREATQLTQAEAKQQRMHTFAWQPCISIVCGIQNPERELLKEMLLSVLRQTYSNWELCLVDGSGSDEIEKYLKKLCEGEKRVHYTRTSNEVCQADALGRAMQQAKGEYLWMQQQEDLLEPDALYQLVEKLQEEKKDLIYTDSDTVDRGETLFHDPLFKPQYSLYLLRSMNYIGRSFALKKELADSVGVPDCKYKGAEDYDYVLRCCEKAENIGHIPKVLWHQRAAKESTQESVAQSWDAGKEALQQHYHRCGVDASVCWGELTCTYETSWQIAETPLVSILIPNMDHSEDLEKCVDSVVQRTEYQNFEILIIENNSKEKATFACYERLQKKYSKVQVITWEEEFNYSAINNFAVSKAKGDYLLFLNNDTEVINGSWLNKMLGICQQPGVGVVGAKLFYPDDTIQHAGVILGLNQIAGHLFVGQPKMDAGYMGKASVMQNLSAVTAACMMVKRTVFEQVGGFEEKLKVALNDVDFCLKVGKAGYMVVYTPHAKWYHFESKSRGQEDTPEKKKRYEGEKALFCERWNEILATGDPFYSPNLSLTSWACAFRIPKNGN